MIVSLKKIKLLSSSSLGVKKVLDNKSEPVSEGTVHGPVGGMSVVVFLTEAEMVEMTVEPYIVTLPLVAGRQAHVGIKVDAVGIAM